MHFTFCNVDAQIERVNSNVDAQILVIFIWNILAHITEKHLHVQFFCTQLVHCYVSNLNC